ncbi:hypothetical protein BDV18DRAFT_157589 [Aspergillus unguis]
MPSIHPQSPQTPDKKKKHIVRKKDHPGSSTHDIANEPNWATEPGHHRLGFRNACGRFAGRTHSGDDAEDVREARAEIGDLKKKVSKGELVSFRDVIGEQREREGFHIKHPGRRPPGFRYVPGYSEEWIKQTQQWPVNVKKKQKEEERKREEVWKNKERWEDAVRQGLDEHQEQDEEQQGEEQGQGEEDKRTPEEKALIAAITHEQQYMRSLSINTGKGESPNHSMPYLTIDEADQFTSDNWVSRSPNLIRLTGKIPLNAEPPLSKLFDAGLITPNELHYVRSHGPVPLLVWEFHELEINGRVKINMHQLTHDFDSINIPILLACDNTRRKELNMLKRTTGFNWGPGGVGCAYWKGPLLRDVLLACGVPEKKPDAQRWWIHLEGADEPSEGKYATSIPFEHVMDPANDVILAYEMNDRPLPPDHGFPVRVMIPGYVGGRCVKWLHKIWTSPYENDSHYHLYDNRMLPSFVTDGESEIAQLLFQHPDTACYEQILSSVICRPEQGETIPLNKVKKGETYRIAGFAYSGSGHPIRRVEVSLNEGKTWMYCIRRFPDRPIRHDNKFWTWVHWHVDVDLIHLVQAKSISVRGIDSAKNTQPEFPRWNLSGSMNNCVYTVKPELVYSNPPFSNDNSTSSIKNTNHETGHVLFRHPVEPANGDQGWMNPSAEVQIQAAKQTTTAPQKQFTREEIEKHNSGEDCWIVVNGNVYDATSVLSWHPGGSGPILAHAGAVHQDTTEEYNSIHDDYAMSKLNECILGTVTDKAMQYIQKNAEAKAQEKQDTGKEGHALDKHRWTPVRLKDRTDLNQDTRVYTFQLPKDKPIIGIGTCQHIEVAFHMKDRMLIRPYTPTKPLLPPANKNGLNGNDPLAEHRDGQGIFQLTVKTYFPDDEQPGGALSNILDCIPVGEDIDIRGPTGDIIYEGFGNFLVSGERRTFKRVSLIIGGSGITPGYALVSRILLTAGDETEVRVIDANKTPDDILLHEQLHKFAEDFETRFKIAHVIAHPPDDWAGLKGHVNEKILKEWCFEPAEENVVILCGPPGMIDNAVLPVMDDWGYKRDENMLGL